MAGQYKSELPANDLVALNTMMDTVREETVNGKPVYVNDFYALRRVIENEMSIVEFDLVLHGHDLDGLKFGRIPSNFIMAILIKEHFTSANPETAIRAFNERLREKGVADFFKAESPTNVTGLAQLTSGTYEELLRHYPELFQYVGKDGKTHTYTRKEVANNVNLTVRAAILLCYHNRLNSNGRFNRAKSQDEVLGILAGMYCDPNVAKSYRANVMAYYSKLNYYDQKNVNVNTLGPAVLAR